MDNVKRKVNEIIEEYNKKRPELNMVIEEFKVCDYQRHFGRRGNLRWSDEAYTVAILADCFSGLNLSELKKRANNRRLRLFSWTVSWSMEEQKVTVFLWFLEYKAPEK